MLSCRIHIACLAAAVSLSLTSCRGEPSLIEVRGSVKFGDKPLTTGIVSLRAEDENSTLHQPTGIIDAQGNYRVFTNYQPGAPPGTYRAVVFATEPLVDTGKASPGMPKSIIPKRYNDTGTSPLSVEVKADAIQGAYDLRLEADSP